MKIGIVTYSLSAGGGVSTFVLSLGRYLSSLGHEVVVITEQSQGAWYPEIARSGLKGDYRNVGIREWLPFGKLIYAHKMGMLLREGRYDAILLNHCLFSQLSAHLYNRSTVVVSVIHNNNRGVYMVGGRNVGNIDAVACVSAATQQGARRYIDPQKLHCIPNGIELPETTTDSSASNQFPPLKIIFVGRLNHEQKGIFFIPEILKQCREKAAFPIEMTIIGDGPEKNQLIERLKEKEVEDLVTFKGIIPREAVYKQYMTHHIFLMPSFYEGLPLTLIESMSCGCVPIASHLEKITDYCVEAGVDGFLPPVGATDSFADAIITLGNNSDLRQTMSRLCREKAARNFSIQRMGNDYLTLINELQEKRAKKIYIPEGYKLRNIHWKDFFPESMIIGVKRSIERFKRSSDKKNNL